MPGFRRFLDSGPSDMEYADPTHGQRHFTLRYELNVR